MSATLNLPIQKVRDDAVVPQTAYEGDAGLDLHSCIDVTLAPFERVLVPTGIALAIPEGYAGFVLPRSGMALKRGLSLANTPGLIDSGYRGEISCIAVNLDSLDPIDIKKGERIAQLVVMKVEQLALQEVIQLDCTQRGSGGFGSSGTD